VQFNWYLYFDGRCEEAFRFYEQLLGGKIEFMMPHGGSPAAKHAPAGWENKILHGRMTIGGQVVMGSDLAPEHFQKSQGFSVSIGTTDVAEAERVFQGLTEGGTVTMPMQATFWAKRFGMLVDRFGIPWMVNCEDAAHVPAQKN
jgi:PhnB protein